MEHRHMHLMGYGLLGQEIQIPTLCREERLPVLGCIFAIERQPERREG